MSAQAPVPRVVYKYFSAEGLTKTLRDCRFLVRPVSDYNDPFECLPQFDDLGLRHMLARFFERSDHLRWLADQTHLL